MTPQSAHQKLTQRLTKLRTLQTANDALAGVGIALIFVLGAGLSLIALETIFYLSPAFKIILEILSALILLFILTRYCVLPFFKPPNLDVLALSVENHFGGLQQQLISALQLWQDRDHPGHSTDLVDAAIIQAEQATNHLHFETMVNRKRPARAAFIAIGLAVFSLLLHANWPGLLSGAIQRLANPQTVYHRPPDTIITLHPGNMEVVGGEPFAIIANLSGIVPRIARLYVREEGVQTWASFVLPVKQSKASYHFQSVTRSFDYRISAHDAETPAYTVTVRPRPIVARILHDDQFPPHTNLPNRVNQQGGDIIVPQGTQVSLTIETNQPIEEAHLIFDDDTQIPATVTESIAKASFTVQADKRYSIRLRDTHMVTNNDPVEYRIVALPDQPPDVKLLRPGRDVDLGESMRVSLVAEAFDDYSVSRLEVRYQMDEEEHTIPIAMTPGREVTAAYSWDMSNLNLLPSDEVTYRIRAYDNNPKPSFGETATFTIRFPSLFEIHQAAEKAQQESIDQMETVQQQGQELDERLQNLAQDLLSKEELDWQDKREFEKALQTQEQLAEQIESTSEQLQEALDQLEESGMLQDDTLQKLEELQELLSQIQTPELLDAMEKLDEAIKNADSDRVREALEDFQQERDKFHEAIDRALALLERVRQQQTLDALNEKMNELANAQNQMTQDIGQEPSEELQRREEQIARDTDQLQEELEQAAQQMDSPTDNKLNQIADNMQKQNLTDRMDQVRRDISANQQQSAQKGSQSLAQDLQQLSQQLQQARDDFVQQQKDEVAKELNRVLHDLLTLSQAQERTAQRTDKAQDRSETAPLALDQARNIAGASRMAQRMLEASQKTFFIPPKAQASLGNALKKMEGAAEQLNSGNANSAAKLAREAMGAVNQSAMMVQNALSQLANSQSGTGFEEMMQQMADLAQQQGDLNSDTEGMMGQPGSKPGGQPSWQQLAAQQRAIQEALNALRSEMAKQRRDMLGDLGKIAGDMQETARELARQQATPETLKRQQQILSRMLDAQQAMRERGKSKKRQARAGENVAYKGPGSLPADLGEVDNPLRRHLRDALKEGYSAEYQALIRKYFENLIEDAHRQKQTNE